MIQNDGGPAFPCEAVPGATDERWQPRPGMSLRDWFAGQVLVGLLSKLPLVDQKGQYGKAVADKIKHNMEIAESCYWLADAMLAAREPK